MRVFVDTNVLASALMGRGLCSHLLDQPSVDHVVVFGAPVQEELHRVLREKFWVPATTIQMLMNKLAELEQDPPCATEWRGASISDPDDIPILACALAAKAPFFVTTDKALRALGMIEGMAIVSPRECWELIASCEGVSSILDRAWLIMVPRRISPAPSWLRRSGASPTSLPPASGHECRQGRGP